MIAATPRRCTLMTTSMSSRGVALCTDSIDATAIGSCSTEENSSDSLNVQTALERLLAGVRRGLLLLRFMLAAHRWNGPGARRRSSPQRADISSQTSFARGEPPANARFCAFLNS